MITEIREGYHVKRFHTTRRIREETIGHHSANVVAILLRLDPSVSRDCIIAGLFHDVAEVYTGDVPAPFKWENPDAKLALKSGEFRYNWKYSIPTPELTESEQQLLKVADMVDLLLSSMEEVNLGNKYASHIVENVLVYLGKMGLSREIWLVIDKMTKEVGECQPLEVQMNDKLAGTTIGNQYSIGT